MAGTIKEILCMAHSHLDVGYTHPQEMLWNLQADYIEQALDLCVKTESYPEAARFRWTCEASAPVEYWLETAQPERAALFRRLVREGRISITALPMHTTPGCSAAQMVQMLQRLPKLRELTGSAVTCAISHDVNGQPWTLAPLLLDAGVEFYMTGINIHMGGIPMPRPCAFLWETTDGRVLPSFVGEHYSLFSQFLFTEFNSTAHMHRGVSEYIRRIEETTDWEYDFVVLTATNPPLYDNNNPDSNLPELIARYNAEGHPCTIRFITPEMLWKRLQAEGAERMPKRRGDWTDYWNFGSGSTARETKISRRAKGLLQKSDFLAAVARKDTPREAAVRERAYQAALLFDEHTWGAAESVTDPHRDECTAQLITKKSYAYAAASNAAYLLAKQTEMLAGNHPQGDALEGALLINPHGFPVLHEVRMPTAYTQKRRTLAALRAKDFLPFDDADDEISALGWAEVPPYSMRRLPFSTLTPESACPQIAGDILQTPFYTVELDHDTRRIKQIIHRESERSLLDETSRYGLFLPVRESIDPDKNPSERRTIFPRDVDLGNRSISQWNTAWVASRQMPELCDTAVTAENGNLTLTYTWHAFGWALCRQRITFSVRHDRILLDLELIKPEDTEPCALYCAFPLRMDADWQCVFDTADTFVRLDDDQLDTVCRDWVTVDKTVSVFDEKGGVTLACPDAPLVQVGGFHFGREQHRIPRHANPLLLAWPMNNYWDTNFADSQSGRITLHYELRAFSHFAPEKAFETGVLAAGGCVQGCLERCDESGLDTWLSCDSRTAYPILIRPTEKEGQILIVLKNFLHTPNRVTVTDVTARICAAAITDLSGHPREQLSLTNGRFTVELPPDALVLITAERT